MADYKLGCCGGFPDHTNWCRVPEESLRREQEENQKRIAEFESWKKFFKGLTEEQVFEYLHKAEVEIAKADKWHKRRKRAMQFMDMSQRLRYLDWKRERYGR